jgi:DNA-binding CsgD family transcriptional regulator
MQSALKKLTQKPIAELLEDLREKAQADAAVFLHFGMLRDRIVVTDVIRSGDIDHWGLMIGGEPPEGFDHDERDDAIGMRREQWCLRAPLRRHFNTFCWLDEDIGQVAPWERTTAYDALYATNGFEAQYRAIFADHTGIQAWCGLFWQSVRNKPAVETAVAEVLDDLRGAAQAWSSGDPGSHRILLANGDELIGFSPESEGQFNHDQLRRIGRIARRRAMMGEEHWCHGRWGVSYVPMTGDAGDAHLVILEPLEPVTIDMRCAMTSQQRELALIISEGATNAEAAAKLDVSTNTVKYHLKKIYPIVGVSNRVELASFMIG